MTDRQTDGQTEQLERDLRGVEYLWYEILHELDAVSGGVVEVRERLGVKIQRVI